MSALVVGCSHEVESPEVSVKHVEPALVCRAQRKEPSVSLTVTGSGFTPMPTNVLAEPAHAILPSLSLSRTVDLDGTGVSDAPVLFSGDPDGERAGNLSWESEEQMRFRVTEKDATPNAPLVDLAPGIYDLTLTNPDKVHTATLAGGLAVVDPPSITGLQPVPPALCIEQDPRELVIDGHDFLVFDNVGPTVTLTPVGSTTGAVALSGSAVVITESCKDLPSQFTGPKAARCDRLRVELPQGGKLPAGTYSVVVTSPEPANCQSSESFQVVIVDPPVVTSVVPSAACVAQGDRIFTLTGTSFATVGLATPTVTLTDAQGKAQTFTTTASGCTDPPGVPAGFGVQLCTTLDFTAGAAVVAGSYRLTVTNPPDVGCTSSQPSTLLIVGPPVITSLEPPGACQSGSAQQVHVLGSNFATVGAAQPTVQITDASGNVVSDTPDQVSGCGAAVGSVGGADITLCTDLVFTLPATTAEGVYSLVITNPDPLGCSSTPPTDLFVFAPPTITSLAPALVCADAGNQPITITGTSFVKVGTALPTVTLTSSTGTATDYVADSVGGCGSVVGQAGGQDVVVCTTVTFTVTQGQARGLYDVTVKDPAPIPCTTATPAQLEVTVTPTITSLGSPQICSGGSELVISGSDFSTGAVVTVTCGTGTSAHVVDSLATQASADGTSISVRFGFGAIPGETCTVTVTQGTGCTATAPTTMNAVDGPILFYAAPPVVYNGINTQLELFLTQITGAPTVRMVPSGQISGGVTLSSTIDPNHPNRLQALVAKGTAPGTYDILVSDGTGCSATLVGGVVVTAQQTILLEKVVQPYGQNTKDNAVSIFRVPGTTATNVAFAPTPSAFLNPVNASATTAAVQLVGVTFVNDTLLTAVVPAGITPGVYDLVVVDGSGNVGVLANAYTATTAAPPVIDNASPQSIVNAATVSGSNAPQTLTVFGQNFDAGATVSLICETPTGASVQPASVGTAAPVCTSGACTLTVAVDGSGLSPGDVCLVRVTNSDGAFADYSAVGVTNPSQNLSNPQPGTDLLVGRRALCSGAVKATSAARFVYAAGGDGGPTVATAPFDSVELAPVGVFGGMQPWVANREHLNQARAFAGTATVGRYIYVFGGTDGANALDSAERALVLSPAEIPVITDVDLCLSGGATPCYGTVPTSDGLLSGEYSYRIAAVISPTSARNLGGETLASDPLIISLPSIVAAGQTRKVAVQLTWTAPVDSLGVTLEDIIGYRIYRTPPDGQAAKDEGFIGQVDASTFTFIDSGMAADTAQQPLPQGSTSAWQVLPNLAVPRNALTGAAARDPSAAATWHLYALLGMNSGDTDALTGTPYRSFEYLDVSVLPNARQDVGTSWKTGSQTASLLGRFLHGSWVVDQQVFPSLAANQTYIYVGGGRKGPTQNDIVGNTENLQVQPGGDLLYNRIVQANAPSRTGFATMAAFGRLFVLGGADPQPKADASSVQIIDVNTLDTSYNNEGIQLIQARYVPGFSVQSAFLFLVGGQPTLTTVTPSSEMIVW